jgi:hypothetical protein
VVPIGKVRGKMRIVFLNTTILTTNGIFSLETVSLDGLKKFLSANVEIERLSAIGHESAAQIMSELLEEQVAVNRIQYTQDEADIAICFKLKGRAPEGVILSREDIEAIGYEFKALRMLSNVRYFGEIE